MFFSAFALIFLAALPGRTTFILMALSSTSKTKNILLGACAAFLIQALISVLLGRALAYFPPPILRMGAGALFLYFGWKFWIKSQKETDSTPEGQSIRSIFILIFVAELGDVSQLAIASVAATAAQPLTILAAAILAMFGLTVLAVYLGKTISKYLKPVIVQRFASIIFVAIGLYLMVKAVFTL